MLFNFTAFQAWLGVSFGLPISSGLILAVPLITSDSKSNKSQTFLNDCAYSSQTPVFEIKTFVII